MHRVRVVGPLEPYAAGFAAELTRLAISVVFRTRAVEQLIAHLSRWLAGEGLDASMLMPAWWLSSWWSAVAPATHGLPDAEGAVAAAGLPA